MSRVIERRKYTVPELARLWGVSTNKIAGFIRSGQLKATNLASTLSGRPRYAIDIDAVEDFESARQVPAEVEHRQKVQRRDLTVKRFF
jgi:hypothetical protein